MYEDVTNPNFRHWEQSEAALVTPTPRPGALHHETRHEGAAASLPT